ncbi:hypothetical protein ACHAXA_010232 [Cyclostephanos tholiformis]|uniref:Uncharacterized protein n=1 Tax=Cyclostephanos tholiformis TaxID=382380 RepID=A0ABD3SFZ0_9STRA
MTLAVAGSDAWTNGVVASCRHPPSSPGPTPNPPNSALQYRVGDEYHHQQVESSMNNVISDELDTNMRLQIALRAARDADRLHGLCSPASVRAWRVVDDIYSSSSVSREVEKNVKRVLGEEKSIWSAFQR